MIEMPEWTTRFLQPVGTRAFLRIYWGGVAGDVATHEPPDPCPNSYGSGKSGGHSAQVFLAETSAIEDWTLGGGPGDHPESAWPTSCEHCGAVAPASTLMRRCCNHPDCDRQVPVVTRCINHRTIWQELGTTTTKTRDSFEPGDLYYATWYQCKPVPGGCVHGWSNCDGKHLICVLPSTHRHPWDIDGRASNCDQKDDTTHRCWVRRGQPELGEPVHVDKTGLTCNAGAGSIAADHFHGFLHNGKIVQC